MNSILKFIPRGKRHPTYPASQALNLEGTSRSNTIPPRCFPGLPMVAVVLGQLLPHHIGSAWVARACSCKFRGKSTKHLAAS